MPAAGCSLLKHFAVKRKHEEDAKSKASAASAASAASVNGSEEKATGYGYNWIHGMSMLQRIRGVALVRSRQNS